MTRMLPGGLRPEPGRTPPRMQSSARGIAHEPRWHASLAVLAAVALYITLPPKLTIGPAWIAPLLVLAVLVPLSILGPRRHAETRRMRLWSIVLIAIVNFFNIASIALLIHGFFHPTRAAEFSSAAPLLRHGFQIWLTNILVFGLWYYEMDGGGPESRAHARTGDVHSADFLYPQAQLFTADRQHAFPAWKPRFFDYLYLAFTNATAFSPTDTFPLTQRAKCLMAVEALISLATIAIILARSVSLIQ
jgi:hypothetical protein